MTGSILDVLMCVFIGTGLLLATIGLIGLLRTSDLYLQTHAAGLVTGPAVIAILLAAFATGKVETTTSAVLVAVFVVITAPLSSHSIAGAMRRRETTEPAGEKDYEEQRDRPNRS